MPRAERGVPFAAVGAAGRCAGAAAPAAPSGTPAGGPRPAAVRSIAVLPFQNLSGDPEQEYFSDGMTDALIGRLAKISALRVISRTSIMRYKGTRVPLHQIGAS